MKLTALPVRMKTVAIAAAFLAILFSVASCSKQADLIIHNRSGADVSFVASDGKGATAPNNGELRVVFPGEGIVFWITSHGVKRQYSIPNYPPRIYRANAYPYAISVVLKEDLKFYLVYPDATEVNVQPVGFPVEPK